MKRMPLAVAALCGLAAACGEAAQTNAADAGSGPVVSGFADPGLKGMTVRNHAEGVIIVTAPAGWGNEPPAATDQLGMALWLMYAPGAVIAKVDGTPIRDGAHFRELMNRAPQEGKQRTLTYGASTRVSAGVRPMGGEGL